MSLLVISANTEAFLSFAENSAVYEWDRATQEQIVDWVEKEILDDEMSYRVESIQPTSAEFFFNRFDEVWVELDEAYIQAQTTREFEALLRARKECGVTNNKTEPTIENLSKHLPENPFILRSYVLPSEPSRTVGQIKGLVDFVLRPKAPTLPWTEEKAKLLLDSSRVYVLEVQRPFFSSEPYVFVGASQQEVVSEAMESLDPELGVSEDGTE